MTFLVQVLSIDSRNPLSPSNRLLAMDSEDWANPDDWELVNDDGFVYKKRRRPLLESLASSSLANQPSNPEAELKNLRERKRRTLLKLRDKYLKEIQQWELLSTTFQDIEPKAQVQLQERQGLHITTSADGPSISEEHAVSSRQRLLDDLLSQVEAQEAFTQSVSNLCDIAETLCSAHEERMKQQFTDLPILKPTPCELMAALGEG